MSGTTVPAGSQPTRTPLERVDEASLLDADTGQDPRRQGRRRRPTGEAPPLPASQRWAGVRWALVSTVVIAASLLAFVYSSAGPVLQVDESVTAWITDQRTPAAVTVAGVLDGLTDPVLIGVLRWATIVVLLAVRRLRHLAVYVAALLLVEWAVQAMNFAIERPRPMVEILGGWKGFSHPSRPVAALTVTALASLRVLAPHGPVRRVGAIVIGALVSAVGLARVVIGVEHVSDGLVAAAMAAGIVFALTRLLVPHSRHPVEYRRGQTAHVTLDEARDTAIRRAVADQLGLQVTDIALHGEVGSAGSTPMLLTVTGDGPHELFAKLYTRQHLRSDRLYKLVRLLMYGRLEDEAPFASVRQLVQHEDHITRVLRDAGVRVPASHGVVEITPEHEYLIAFEFTAGHDLDIDEPVSDALIDDCLRLVEQLWTAGVAHRDIKPGNVMVDGDTATLIDVAFAQVRPTPWRQAVDLGAMMLMLGLAAGPERVHARALRIFDADELAEALAATDGFAVPSQLRDLLAEDEWVVRDALAGMVPHREPIRIHRWDRRRIMAAGLTAAALAAAVVATWVAFDTVGLV